MKTCPTCQHTYPDDFSLCPRDGAHLTSPATETEAQLAAGLSRRFRLVRRLGKGGMGTVFLAEQIGVGNRPVALKVLNRKLLDDPDFLMRFQNEAGSTGRIHHTNVVTIYESAQSDDGTPYIAMEFLEGESLREVIKQRGALPPPEVAEILQQAAGGLNAAHKLGIIHRDLKPDNIFLTHGDEGEIIVKVVDFGIAKLRESTTHTMTGTVLGTPAYMSYEQASGMRSDELDARSDIYSMGVVVYEMLTGRTPFQSDTPVGYLRKHLMEEPPPFGVVEPGLPVSPQIESVVMKALTKDRTQRYGSVLEFAQEFAQAADAGSQLAAQPEPKREAAKTQRQTIVTSAPKRIVPAAVRDTVAAKVVPETAHPLRRQWLGSRWKRIGIIASVVWILGMGIYFLKATDFYVPTTAQDLYIALIFVAIRAFVPVLLIWGFIYLVLFLVRWIRRAATARPSRRKWLFVGSLIFLIVATAGGYWFYTSYIHRPDFTNSKETTLADAYHVTAFRDGAYIIEHKGHRLTAKCRESLTYPDGPDKPGRPMTDHDCMYMVGMVGKSIGDDLMRQEQNQLVYSPWRGINTVQTADFLDIIHDELIRTGSGLGPAPEQVESPPAIAFTPFALERTLSGDRGSVDSVAFSPDGKLLASGSDSIQLRTSGDTTIQLWDVASGTLRQTLASHKGDSLYLGDIAFSLDGRLMASCSGDNTIRLWDVASGKLRHTLSGHHGSVLSVAFSPDGKVLASGSTDPIVKLWDVTSGAVKQTLTLSTGQPKQAIVGREVPVAFSPDGRLLAVSPADNTVEFLEMPTGNPRRTLTGQTNGAITVVAFSPDGKVLASAGDDGTVKLWDVASGVVRQTLTGHTDPVYSVAFSPDGKLLASGSGDKTIKLWDVASGNLRQTLTGHSGIVFSVAFSPDGKLLASGSLDKTIMLWRHTENVTGSIGQQTGG